jgi:spore cortex protein
LKRKHWIIIPISGLVMLGIAGCAGNNRADVNNRYNDNARPIGYYSNENHPNQNSGFFNDDGPITEMMDHNLGTERKSKTIQTRNINNIPPTPIHDNDRDRIQDDNRLGINNGNHADNWNQRNNRSATGTNAMGKLSGQIRMKANGVDNVQDVRSVVNGSNILITVQLKDKNKAKQTKKAIRKAIRPYTDGRSVTIHIDNDNLNSNLNRNNDLLERGTR